MAIPVIAKKIGYLEATSVPGVSAMDVPAADRKKLPAGNCSIFVLHRRTHVCYSSCDSNALCWMIYMQYPCTAGGQDCGFLWGTCPQGRARRTDGLHGHGARRTEDQIILMVQSSMFITLVTNPLHRMTVREKQKH